MNSTNKTARFAGFLYLLLALIAPIGLMYVPAKLIVYGDASTTARNIVASQSLYLLGIASQLVSTVIFIFLAMVLYRLLKAVDQPRAVLMVVLVLVQVPISFLNEVNAIAALVLARGAAFLSIFDQPQRDALAMLFLNLHYQGILVNQVFWGLWLFPFGLLVFRSRFLPRFLGIWLVLNGAAYVVMSFTGLMLPRYYNMVYKGSIPLLLGEMVTILWFLILGAKPHLQQPASSASAGD